MEVQGALQVTKEELHQGTLYDQIASELAWTKRMLERATRLVEEHIDGSDETWSIARKRNKLVKEVKKGYNISKRK